MKGSIERVRAVVSGELPDRTPLYELFRNDAVIEHFTGEKLTVENGQELVYKAYAPAVDATRPLVRAPIAEGTGVREDGRKEIYYRWTTWKEHRSYADSDAYAADKKKLIDAFNPALTAEDQSAFESKFERYRSDREKLGEVFFFPTLQHTKITTLYDEVGLEYFAYYMVDCPGIIDELLEMSTLKAVQYAEYLPEAHGIEAGFLGDDIAFKSGPLFSPKWLGEHYFPRLARVIDAYHKRGIKVLFHSDGNLNIVLDALVEAGIDGLNPIEVMADMDVGDIHRRYPHLFMSGAIDVSQLLPYGSPQEIRDTVKRTIEAAEGRIMIGSSTELHDEVPLENYLAMREAVLG